MEVLAILANNFENMSVLTRSFMKDVLDSGDKGGVRESVADLRAFKVGLENFWRVMAAQALAAELNS